MADNSSTQLRAKSYPKKTSRRKTKTILWKRANVVGIRIHPFSFRNLGLGAALEPLWQPPSRPDATSISHEKYDKKERQPHVLVHYSITVVGGINILLATLILLLHPLNQIALYNLRNCVGFRMQGCKNWWLGMWVSVHGNKGVFERFGMEVRVFSTIYWWERPRVRSNTSFNILDRVADTR